MYRLVTFCGAGNMPIKKVSGISLDEFGTVFIKTSSLKIISMVKYIQIELKHVWLGFGRKYAITISRFGAWVLTKQTNYAIVVACSQVPKLLYARLPC